MDSVPVATTVAAMTTIRVQTNLQDITRQARDQYVNTLWFHRPDPPTQVQLDFLVGIQHDFYDAISTYLSPTIPVNGHTTKAYDWADPPVRQPKAELTWNFLSAPGGYALPSEVALCLTFHAERHPGIKPQSTRGRIYVGPFNTSCVSTDTDAVGRPLAAVVDGLLDAGQVLNDQAETGGWSWIVASKKQNKGYQVVELGVDNSWDTQRSRGMKTTRTGNVPTEHASATPSGIYPL